MLGSKRIALMPFGVVPRAFSWVTVPCSALQVTFLTFRKSCSKNGFVVVVVAVGLFTQKPGLCFMVCPLGGAVVQFERNFEIQSSAQMCHVGHQNDQHEEHIHARWVRLFLNFQKLSLVSTDTAMRCKVVMKQVMWGTKLIDRPMSDAEFYNNNLG